MTDLEKEYDEAYKKAIAGYLRERVKTDEYLREACRKEGKSLDSAVAYVKSEARKQASDGVAVIADSTVYEWVVHYLLEDDLSAKSSAKKPSKAKARVSAEKAPAEKPEAKKKTAEKPEVKKTPETLLDELQLELF